MFKDVPKTQQEVLSITKEYINKIKPIFDDKLKKVIIFGSYARGDFDSESDIDILVLIDDDEKNLNKFNSDIIPIEVDINLENDVVLAPIFLSEKKFTKFKGVLPFYHKVDAEGVIVYEQ